MVLSAVVNGMPLVYGGQEADLDRSLSFFERDTIQWKEHPFYNMYKTLFTLKHNNQALWNGSAGAEMVRVYNDKLNQVISFSRVKNNHKVLPIINFSNEDVTVVLDSKNFADTYVDVFSNKSYTLRGNDTLTLKPWGYFILAKN